MLSRLSSFSGPLSPLFNIPVGGFTTDGLILRYVIGDSNSYSLGTTVTDLQSNSNGSLVNNPTYSINGYLNFDGSNDHLMTNTSLNSKLSPPNTSSVISYFIWVYPQDNGVIITEQGSATLNTSWHDSQIEMVSGVLKFRVWNDSGFSSSIPTPINKWYYVGLTYDGTTLRGYVNAQQSGSVNIFRLTPYNTGGFVGLHYGIAGEDNTNLGDGTYAKMKFGDFHVYNTALSQKQILTNYNETKSSYIYTEDMLIWIDANDPGSFSGGSLNDLSGNYFTHSIAANVTSSIIHGFRSFDCTSSSDNHIRVNGTGPTLSTSGYTYVAWSKIIADSSDYRTLYRASPNDYALLVQIGTDNLGFWDNDSNSFKDSGYDVSSIEEKWVQYSVVGDLSSSIFYINDIQVGSVSYGAGGNKHDYFGGLYLQPFGYVGNMMLYNKKLTQNQIKQNYDALKNVYKNGDFVINNLKLYFNPSNILSYPGSGLTIADITGNSLNGTLSNITFDKPYFNFNGSSSQVTVADNALLEPGSGDWTMEAWFNVANTTGSKVILGKFDNGGGGEDVSYSIRISNANLFTQVGNGTIGGFVNSGNYVITANTWYQVVYVWTNVATNSFTTYINGLQVLTVGHNLVGLLNSTNPLYLGSYNNGEFSQWFNGKMGIVRIYSAALSASDVSKNFEASRGIYGL